MFRTGLLNVNPLTFDPDAAECLWDTVDCVLDNLGDIEPGFQLGKNATLTGVVQEINTVMNIMFRKTTYVFYKAFYWVAEIHFSSLLGLKVRN